MDRDELVRVFRAFESAGLEYVLIGATAMGFHGLVRATEDVDLFVRATPENVERLRHAFRSAYPGDPHVDEIRAEDLLGEYPALRYYPPTGDLFFDVMTRLGEAASFDTVQAEVKEIEGIRVRASPRRQPCTVSRRELSVPSIDSEGVAGSIQLDGRGVACRFRNSARSTK